MLYNKKLIVEYVGTDFAGWQVQPNGRTVQEELHKALSKMYKTKVTVIGSGRTDSGVHALGQVANFRTERYIPPENVHMGLNSMLPEDISISSVEDVPEDFHAQLNAVSKTYLYRIFPSRVRSAMLAGRTWWVKDELNYKRMCELLKYFEGEHDFTSFCVQTSLRENNVRRINNIRCYREDKVICIEINGNGFLHNMVRIIAGTVVEALRKGYGDEYIKEAIEGRDRSKAGPTAHAAGLYLKKVYY
ncbi:tRNA pseudouridine synthase A [Denitrovibrio acetiphilus DSM 12809]|uniref:tRNA pseudouridine synthase A n=1 Tax=Denitrovibrio acetiphilus (strain DSM 12809 / NBRC 114555 / N2460) TaxID=522772 RepID=D4H707_DENA2|nr:tRNA pseudouridine(38-40) synthase TruA [Denitrovibrio acetiphilus]ADD69711.1 tRNA pseudouridine synthase A [Denitrovibrio acetiphilus DSM 12809]